MSIPAAGIYQAKFVQRGDGTTKNGSAYETVLCEITEQGPEKGKRVYGELFYTPATIERTKEAFRAMGWDGKDLANLHGLGSVEFRITVVHETFGDPPRTKAKVKWINGLGGGVYTKKALTPDERRKLAIRFGSAAPQATPAPKSDDDIPF